jgi:hypothetical protein
MDIPDKFAPVVSMVPLVQLTNQELVFTYLCHLSEADRKKALAQEGELGDRLREAMTEYQKWYEKEGPRIEKERTRREKRRERRRERNSSTAEPTGGDQA